MAKKKQDGPGTGMIITLVFFVLATLILGVTTYMGFDGMKELEETANKEKEAAKKANDAALEDRVRLAVNRTSLGVGTEADFSAMSGASGPAEAAKLAEIQNVTSKLGGNAFPTPGAFNFPAAGTGPTKSVAAIVGEWAKMYQAKAAEAAGLSTQLQQANARVAQADKQLRDETEKYNKGLADENKRVTDAIAAGQVGFDKTIAAANTKGNEFKKAQDQWSADKAALEDVVAEEKRNVKSLQEKLAKALQGDQSDLGNRFDKLQLEKLDQRKGEIASKDDTFVTLRFQTRLGLVPGQSFIVIAPTASLVDVIEQEKAIEKRHREYASIRARDPFTDHQMIKGMVEITSVTGPFTAQARIISQPNALRNPIAKGDQIFNISLSTSSREHVAFAGIIDLDGDGLPDNEEFIRMVERNGVIVDAFLDLKTGEVKKRQGGMSLRTKFLIVGTDVPPVGKVKEMMAQAKELGVQLIDAPKFMALIGVKPPTNAAAPQYGKVNLGVDGPPAVEGKTPEGKKDDGK